MKIIKTIFSIFVIQCIAIGSVTAANLDGMEFSDTIQTQNGMLVLNGLGPRLATMAKIKVYVAGLYLPEKLGDADAVIRSSGEKKLVMKFQRDVSAEQSRDAWTKGLEKASKEYPNIADRIPQLMTAMCDMKKGEEMSYSFMNDQVEILVRGESKAVIKGKDFTEALFTVWLKYPPNKEFAKGILGQ